MQLVHRKAKIVNRNWLPDMDLNHDKVIQSHLCYRYTIGQTGLVRLNALPAQSSRVVVPKGRPTIAHGFNRGSESHKNLKPRRGDRKSANSFCRPSGTRFICHSDPRLKPWAIFGRASGTGVRGADHVSRFTFHAR
jgi:hypothetical protein